MSVGKQIKIYSNFLGLSSKQSSFINSATNIANEFERKGEQKNKDINSNLSNENIIFKKFDKKELLEYLDNTDYSLNSSNSKMNDFFATTPIIQATNFVNLGGINLTFLMSKDEWVDFYKDVSKFIKGQLGEDFRILSEVIQFDEFTPHLQLMGLYRTEISNEKLSQKDIENDFKLFEEISRKQFTRFNNKNKGTDLYVDPKNKKEYKIAKEKWINEHREEIIKNYKPRNKTTTKKYAFIKSKTLQAKKNSYSLYQENLYKFCKEHKFINKLLEKATELRGEKVEFVKKTTEPTWDGKSKNHNEIKNQIEEEEKEIQRKIKNGEKLSEIQFYRHIRYKNRTKLKNEFLSFNVETWKEKFNKPLKLNYNFNQKLANDYLEVGKEIVNKEVKDLINTKKELTSQNENIKKLIEKNKIAETNLNLLNDLKNKKKKVKIKTNLLKSEEKEIYETTDIEKTLKNLEKYNFDIKVYQDKINELKIDKRTIYEDNLKKQLEINELKQEKDKISKELSNLIEIMEEVEKRMPKQIKQVIDNIKEIFKTFNDAWSKNLRDKELEKLDNRLGIKNNKKEKILER